MAWDETVEIEDAAAQAAFGAGLAGAAVGGLVGGPLGLVVGAAAFGSVGYTVGQINARQRIVERAAAAKWARARYELRALQKSVTEAD